jgi:hypothetical protein
MRIDATIGVAYYPVMAPMPQWELPHTKVEQAQRTVGLLHKDFHYSVKNQKLISNAIPFEYIDVPLPADSQKLNLTMEVISIERSTYEELLTSFNSFVSQMKAMAGRGTDKRLGEWLDNQDVCQILNISPRTLQTLRQNGTLAYSQIEHKIYYKPKDVERIIPLVEVRKKNTYPYGCHQRKGGGI